MTKQRKEKLLELLKQSSVAINGQALAEHFHVTRQIIVQDIALLRADGASILSTNRGYLYKGADDTPTFHRLFKIKHDVNDMEAELLAIVDNGGRVQNILIEHPVYGEIQTYLKLTCRRDVQHFLQQVKESQFRPLSELTDGVHYHLIQADSQQDLDYVETALRDLGFLLE
ncbi:transcription repressor NadR [Streptococcus gordonii]|uniref:transcription repressor NadR n=1 Tax=Streptococcus gordonii TaxID=1302 RepID=UPI000E5474F7|nr:transcription repressor NadR [Streptococcus gordonii]RHE65749.1 transcription repressor NadR [Streptococcus gordonii]